MIEYSESRKSLFKGLRFSQVCVLIELLQESELSFLDHLNRRFRDKATNFRETIGFLSAIGALRIKESQVWTDLPFPLLSTGEAVAPRREIAKLLIPILIQHKNEYREEMFEYLCRFDVINGRAVHRTSEKERSSESALRNFLIEIGIILYDEMNDCYVISSEHCGLYAMAKLGSGSIYPSVIKKQQCEREVLGLNAERAAVKYERRRVGTRLTHLVHHIAERNARAGYDIESVTETADGELVPRYIEVKAVPQNTFCFYWTANERKVAKVFGAWYFLYLIPVGKNGRIDIESLCTICDPCTIIGGTTGEWIIEDDVVRCCRRNDTTITSDHNRK